MNIAVKGIRRPQTSEILTPFEEESKGLNLLYINGLLQRGIATSGVKERRFPGPQIVLKMSVAPDSM